MTIEEVKEHFKDAKKVRCLSDEREYYNEGLKFYEKINISNDFFEIWGQDKINNIDVEISVMLYSNRYKERLAEIVEYKEDKSNTKPTHYQTNSIDVIDFCSAYGLNFNRGSATKYIARAGSKTYDGLNTKDSELKDLEKAIDFLQREIQTIKNK